MAKSDVKKLRSPEIEVVKKDNGPEATYFKVENGKYILTRYGWDEDPEKGESIVVSAKDTLRLMDSLKVRHPETLIKALGKRFALKEPHNSFVKIQTSLQRRGIPFERK